MRSCCPTGPRWAGSCGIWPSLDVRAGMSDHLVSEAIYLSDPDGLGIEVYADRPRETWQYVDRQLVMDTRPLDVDEPARRRRARANGPGCRTQTVIGHVHLHVADLGACRGVLPRGLGFDKTVWSYPGRLFMSAGGLPPPSRHEHMGGGAMPATAEQDARLLEWELVVPTAADAARRTGQRGRGTGAVVDPRTDGGVVRDPWGTAVHVRAAR